MKILGISCYHHDSAASLMINNKIIAAAQEERFTRKKNDKNFPQNAILFCLKQANISMEDIEIVVFYETPRLKDMRILYTFLRAAPQGFMHFLQMALDKYFYPKIKRKKLLNDLKQISPGFKGKLLFSKHHLSHAASAFFTSKFQDSAIITLDGVGEFVTSGIFYGNGNNIKILKELKHPNSIGLFYSSITYFLGFKVDSGEYKVMGLAPYGNKDSVDFLKYKKLILDNIIKVYDDGSIELNQKYFNYFLGRTIIDVDKWENLLKIKRRVPEDVISQQHCDMALALQEITNGIIISMANEAKQLTGSKNVCLGGGVALNCVSNAQLIASSIFENIHIHVASGDAGGALGAALAAWFVYLDNSRDSQTDYLETIYLGPEYSEDETQQTLEKYAINFEKIDSWSDLYEHTAKLLVKGMIVGWFQDKLEWGPRALGNRSILANPKSSGIQNKINLAIKQREGFRPFAPAVAEEYALQYFEMLPSKEMVYTTSIKSKFRRELPESFQRFPIKMKLDYIRSDFPGITHIDYSCRSQIVNKNSNEKFWSLINAFKDVSGFPILINTSMNVRGEPIVCSPEDALGVLFNTELDFLIIQNFIISKKNNRDLNVSSQFEKSFNLD